MKSLVRKALIMYPKHGKDCLPRWALKNAEIVVGSLFSVMLPACCKGPVMIIDLLISFNYVEGGRISSSTIGISCSMLKLVCCHHSLATSSMFLYEGQVGIVLLV